MLVGGRPIVVDLDAGAGQLQHLLQHAARRIEEQGRLPVVDPAENAHGGPEFFARYGFGDAGDGLMVRVRSEP